MTSAAEQDSSGDDRAGGGDAPGRLLQFNSEALRVVPASRRRFWEQMAEEVEVDYAGKFRKKWSTTETARVILADPSETYDEVAAELERSPGAIRYRRMAMVHILREEHGAPERVEAYKKDPKANHKYHDYHQVHEVLEGLGVFDLPVTQQFEMAQPLQQPSASWRGDGSAASMSGGQGIKGLRDEVMRLLREAKESYG